MTVTLRAADPAAHLDPAPDAQLLADILAVERPRSGRSLRRVAVGGLLAAAAAVAVLVLPMPWDHHGSRLGTAAYAVDRRSDGSVQILLRWDELNDPSGLQHALDAAGARTVVLFGDVIPGTDPGNPPPACAKPWYGRSYSARAVQWDFPDPAAEVNGVIIRPQYFPKDGTFVVEAYRHPGASTYGAELSFMARGAVPTCVYPEYGN
jgi:hypothetical protein